jgi:hypothetical protein
MPGPGGPFLRHCWSTAVRQGPRVHEALGFAARRNPDGEQVGGGVRLFLALMIRTRVHG